MFIFKALFFILWLLYFQSGLFFFMDLKYLWAYLIDFFSFWNFSAVSWIFCFLQGRFLCLFWAESYPQWILHLLLIFGCPFMCVSYGLGWHTVGGMDFHLLHSPASPTHPSLNGMAEWLEPWPMGWEVRKGRLTSRLSLPPCWKRHWQPYQEP